MADRPDRDGSGAEQTPRPALCLRGAALYRYARDPDRLRRFLAERPDRIKAGPTELRKSIIVLCGNVRARVEVVGAQERDKQRPMLRRTGKYPPSMQMPELEHRVTTDADEQRMGCSYINRRRCLQHRARKCAGFVYGYLNWASAASPSERADLEEKLTQIQEEAVGRLLTSGRHDAEHRSDELGETAKGILGGLPRPPYLRRLSDPNWCHVLANLCTDILVPTGAGSAADGVRVAVDGELNWLGGVARPSAGVEGVVCAWRVLLAALSSSVHLAEHCQALSGLVASHIVVQGCGDVSMNYWNVAYTDGKITHAPEEPLEQRVYSCLVGWKGADGASGQGLTVENVLLSRADHGSGRVRRLRSDASPEAIADKIEFALYGQRVVWEAKLRAPRDVVQECSDLRHILDLPNLNPEGNEEDYIRAALQSIAVTLQEGGAKEPKPAAVAELTEMLERQETVIRAFAQRPRYLFGVSAKNDVWLGEHAFLTGRNSAQTATEYPIETDLASLGAPFDWVTIRLMRHDYRLKLQRSAVQERGDSTWDFLDPTDPKLVWYPKLARYPCTMVGVGHLNPQPLGSVKYATEAEAQAALQRLASGDGSGEDHRSNSELAALVSRLDSSLGDAKVAIRDGRPMKQSSLSELVFGLAAEGRTVERYVIAVERSRLVVDRLLGPDSPPGDPCVFLLAWGHDFREDQGYSIFECGQLLLDLGAEHVLLIDEGQDVYQFYFTGVEQMDERDEELPELGPDGAEPYAKVRAAGRRHQTRGSIAFWVQDAVQAPGTDSAAVAEGDAMPETVARTDA